MLSELCVRRPVTATMLVMSLVVLGIFSFRNLGVDLYPKADPATVSVALMLPGASPDEMSSSVVEPMEQAISGVSGIDEIQARIAEGRAQITVRFVLERDINDAANDVREKVASAIRTAPPTLLPPVITKVDPDADPVMSLIVSSDAMSLRTLTELAEKQIARAIQTVNGVGEVSVAGGRAREIHIVVDIEKLNSYGVPSVVGNARIFCSTAGSAAAIPAEAQCVLGQQNRPFSQQLLFDASRRRTFDIDAAYFVSEFAGRHQFKGGYQINALANDVFNAFIDQVSLRYGRTINQTSGVPSSILPPTPGAIGSGLIQRFLTQGSASSRNQAVFFQDGWQPTNRLSLNLGFRVEKETAPSFTPGNPSIEFDFFDKFAPRLGGAYDITGDGKTKVFASYGWFYDRFKYELPRGSFGGDFFHNFYFEIFPGDGRFDTLTPQRIIGI